MKKQLLLGIALGASICVSAQQNYTATGLVIPKINPALANKAMKYTPYDNNDGPASFAAIVAGLTPPVGQAKAYTNTVIGSTIYDLQTNASIAQRSVLNADGTISATWTYSNTTVAGGTPDRGTAYVYFDGTTWSAAPTARLEAERVGWPSMGVTTGGKEITVSHLADGVSHNLIMMSRPAKGTGAWTETPLGIADTWARMVVGGSNGQTVHVISQTKGAAPTNAPYHGQDGALAYSRSLDGGVTWDKIRTIIPQIDSSHYVHFNGDDYNMTAKGDTIAIVIGGLDLDVILLKSVDNGTSWTKTIVYAFPIPLFDAYTMTSDADGDGTPDTLTTNDGSVQVLLDNNGEAHVWYGNMRMIQTAADPTNGAVSYFPGTDGLMYWNESMGSTAPVMIAACNDLNGDGMLNVYNDPSGATLGFGTYYVSLSSMASASVDAMNRIYVSYSSVYEGLSDDGTVAGGKSYRHEWVMRSEDGGTTWCPGQDVTDPEGPSHQDYTEGVFGSLTKRSDNFLHLIYEKDTSPGHGLSGTPAGSTDAQSGPSDIVYCKIPTSDLACPSGVNEIKNTVTMNLYPNPAAEQVKLDFTMTAKADVVVKMVNLLGQTVDTFVNNNTASGANSLTINLSNYPAGVYFVNATIGNQQFSKKLIVQ